jgi:hypothetical protein
LLGFVMARCFSMVLLLGFVMAGASAVAGGRCEVTPLAAAVAASCTATPPCCEPLLASVELGGAACLCRVASETPVLHAGLNGSALLALHADCGAGFILPVRKKNRRLVRNAFIGFLGNFSDSSFYFQIKI